MAPRDYYNNDQDFTDGAEAESDNEEQEELVNIANADDRR